MPFAAAGRVAMKDKRKVGESSSLCLVLKVQTETVRLDRSALLRSESLILVLMGRRRMRTAYFST
jgi:hypothetical protein